MPTTTEYFFYLYVLKNGGYDDLATDPVEHYTDLSLAPADHKYVHNGYTGYPLGAIGCYDFKDKTRTLAAFTEEQADGEQVTPEEALDILCTKCGYLTGTTIANGIPVEPKDM